MLTTPPVKKIDLHFPLGLEVTARNLKGVTIKDALDAIYKQFKKKVRQSLVATITTLVAILSNGPLFQRQADSVSRNRQMTSLTILS
jgi:hypothetical protein